MLPTKSFSEDRPGHYKDVLNLNNSKHDKSLELFRSQDGILVPNPQHLYFLSDDKIEVGDKIVYKLNGENKSHIYTVKSILDDIYLEVEELDSLKVRINVCKKIIATTDKSLEIIRKVTNSALDESIKNGHVLSMYKDSLPQPSQQFIEDYVEAYNAGKPITEVLVEYYRQRNPQVYGTAAENYSIIDRLKVNPDNTINIIHRKDSYTREEVEKLCREAYQAGAYSDGVDNWIKENL